MNTPLNLVNFKLFNNVFKVSITPIYNFTGKAILLELHVGMQQCHSLASKFEWCLHSTCSMISFLFKFVIREFHLKCHIFFYITALPIKALVPLFDDIIKTLDGKVSVQPSIANDRMGASCVPVWIFTRTSAKTHCSMHMDKRWHTHFFIHYT